MELPKRDLVREFIPTGTGNDPGKTGDGRWDAVLADSTVVPIRCLRQEHANLQLKDLVNAFSEPIVLEKTLLESL